MAEQQHPLEIWLNNSGAVRAEFARRVGCSPSHLTLVAQGKRGISLNLALNIERETHRAVTAEQLREHAPEAAQ
jgi:DNA-binding transcriptional regulator YdaS (Cro superfamily)